LSEDLRLRPYRTQAVIRETGQRADSLEALALPGVDRIADTVRRSLGG
jgi:hypothetical protein